LVDAGASGGIPGYVSVAYNDRAGTRSAIVLLPTQPDQAIAARYDEAVATAVCRMFDHSADALRATSRIRLAAAEARMSLN
jgi:hypothetical protein